jgi:glycerol-3-phosphate dehydrogenase
MRLPEQRFDAVVAGGGVYGILLALEGAVRGQRVLLLERDDFGGATSFNHLRTIHGGLRYLQFLDFRRAVISNRQRLWWLKQFPDLIEPISCLMPLYSQGLRRPIAFHVALRMARVLGMHRDGAGNAREIGVLSPGDVQALMPACPTDGLTGGALWQDAFMPRSHRVVAELLHWAEQSGAVVRNRMELVDATPQADGMWQVRVRDHVDAAEASVTTRRIFNATALACDSVAERILGRAVDPVLVPTLAWGMLIDREPLSRCSLALTPPGRGRRTYFLHPYHGRILAGTGHAGLPPGAPLTSGVSREQVDATLQDLNDAVPGLALGPADVRHVFHGILPGVQSGSDALLMHPRVVDHGLRDGAPGVWTVLGVKFTEAPFVARRVWDGILGKRADALPPRPQPVTVPSTAAAAALSDAELSAAMTHLADQEWCHDVEDVAWRRTDLWMDRPQIARARTLWSQTAHSMDRNRSVGS